MKKLIIFLFATAFCNIIFAQKANDRTNSLKGSIVLEEGFESGSLPSGWTMIDADGDGYNWTVRKEPTYTSHTGSYCILSASFEDISLTPNNWLVTPQVDVPATKPVLVFYSKPQDTTFYYREHYKVMVSTTTNTDTLSFTTKIYEETTDYKLQYKRHTIDLSGYAGQKIYIAFVHCGCSDQFKLNLDDITIYEQPELDAAITLTPVKSDCGLNSETIKINIENRGYDSISNFPVSYSINNGTPVVENVSSAIAPKSSMEYTFTTEADFSAVGVYVVAASVGAENDGDGFYEDNFDTIYVENIQPVEINEIPYTNLFTSDEDRQGLKIVNADYDIYTWRIAYSDNTQTDMDFVYNCGMPASMNDWVILKCMNFEAGNYNLKFEYKTDQIAVPVGLKAMIGVSQTNTALTTEISNTVVSEVVEKEEVSTNFNISTPGTYYIGFQIFCANQSIVTLHIDNVSISKVVSIDENSKSQISVYPNPANDIININGAENSRIDILNIVGDVVATVENAEANQKINVGNFSKGMYFVRVNNSVYKINIAR